MLWQPLYSFLTRQNRNTMEITLEKLNNLPYEQMLCIHIVMCSFVAQRQQELMEAGMMDDAVIKMYRDNVEHLIPGSDEAFVQSTNRLLWNLVEAATDSLAKGVNVDFAKQVIEKASEAWEKAQE